MSIPVRQYSTIFAYILKQTLKGNKHYPLVLMLEPLFRCNLSCAGCGKIAYPADILNRRLSVAECMQAIDECGAPMVSIAGGEPLIHQEIEQIVEGFLARKKYIYFCTNGLLLERKLDRFKPSPYFTWQLHLDGNREEHDRSVGLPGTYDTVIRGIKAAKQAGFKVNINCTLFDHAEARKVADFLDEAKQLGVDTITISPGYSYEKAPDKDHFLSRSRTKQLFRDIFRLGRGKKWPFNHSPLYLDFLAGNQTYQCSPWSMPCRNIFGWQRPCYLLNEGYAKTFKELIEETGWDHYGTGHNEKCADCMVHSGFEGSAVADIMQHPLKGLAVAVRGPRTEGPMAPDILGDKP